jgi:hypothetical protein
MSRDHFVKRRKHPKYLAKAAERRRARIGAINDCFRPSVEEMGLRRAHQRKREATVRLVPTGSLTAGNRHGGPHLHQREIARRLRQA